MERYSETIDAITKFLFLGKEEQELGVYDLVIFLGNNDISGNANALKLLYDTGHITQSTMVILSGNVGLLNQGEDPEAERLFGAAVNLGLPKELFMLECKATNALENFKYSKPIAESIKPLEKFENILIIGRAFMTRRAKMCAAACGYPTEKIDFYGTVDRTGKNIGPDSWWKSSDATKRVLEELERIAKYSLKGDLSLE